jgi:hypothetical protein
MSHHSDDATTSSASDIIADLTGKGIDVAGQAATTDFGGRGERSNAGAQIQEVKLSITFTEDESTYTMEDDGYYHESSTRSVMVTQLTVDGEVLPEETEVDTEVPNRDVGDYERLQLKQVDSQVVIKSESRFKLGDKPLYFVSEAELEFVDGDWQKYESGGTVVMKYSEKGLGQLMECLQRDTSKFTSGLEDVLGKFDSVTLKIHEIPNARMTINRHEIQEVSDGVFKVEMTLTR